MSEQTGDGRELDRALDALGEELREVEDWMEGLGLRARAAVRLPSGGLLAWGKTGAAYKLLSVGADGQETPLTNASAGRRVEAADHVQALVAEARDRQALLVEAVAAATAKLRALRGGS